MNVQDFIVTEDNTIIEVMKKIDMNTKRIVFICANGTLLGSVTDGDIRRYILTNGDLNRPIKEIANKQPKFLRIEEKNDVNDFMKAHSITAVPIVNHDNKVLTICFLNDTTKINNQLIDVPVVIMAGGKGTRLYPYTQILPKPLIPVGDKTITELIMDQFELFGCKHFEMIVNHKKNLIKSFFMDNEDEREVSFTDEDIFLGTGGGLKLLEGKYLDTFFVTNCDILVEEDYSDILAYHKQEKNIITIVSAMKQVTIPYGTIDVSEIGEVKKLNEKPTFNFLTNTGLYVLEPEFLDIIPKDTFIHITDIIQKCIDTGKKVGVYPISEHSWLDMGQLEELEKMRERFEKSGR